jgi:hypothetical protein
MNRASASDSPDVVFGMVARLIVNNLAAVFWEEPVAN